MRHFAVVRHADRGDGVCETVNGQRWSSTSDYLRWPLDPPLSDDGVRNSERVANQIRHFSRACAAGVALVVSSPYLRCLQTAASMCEVLGARLVVDRSIGEIYGPSVMGEVEPCAPIRTLADVPAPLRHLLLRSEIAGDWPRWPEDPPAARLRFRAGFLSYLRWASEERESFVMVTHGDALAASLALMPSHSGKVLGRIDCGGMFRARQAHEPHPVSEEAHEPNPVSEGAHGRKPCPEEARTGGWHVETSGLVLHEAGGQERALLHRVRAQSRSMGLPARVILSLVGGTEEAILSLVGGTEGADGEGHPGHSLNVPMERERQIQTQGRTGAHGLRHALETGPAPIEVQPPVAPSQCAPMDMTQNSLFLRRVDMTQNSLFLRRVAYLGHSRHVAQDLK